MFDFVLLFCGFAISCGLLGGGGVGGVSGGVLFVLVCCAIWLTVITC